MNYKSNTSKEENFSNNYLTWPSARFFIYNFDKYFNLLYELKTEIKIMNGNKNHNYISSLTFDPLKYREYF